MPQPSLPPEMFAALTAGDGLVCAADCRGLGISQDRIERMLHGRTRFAAVPDRLLMEIDGVATLQPALVAVTWPGSATGGPD